MAFLDEIQKAIGGIGSSPELLRDLEQKKGGVQPLLGKVLSARYHEAGADPDLVAMSPEDRAAVDRYANFAKMASDSSGPVRAGANYVGGMGAMALTEAMKYARPIQSGASKAWNMIQGTPDAAPFFGGEDTSRPNLANLLAAHYGFKRGREAVTPRTR